MFPLAGVTSVVFARQTGTAPTFSSSVLPTPALSIFPGAVGTIAFGAYASPDYETAAKVIPAVGSKWGRPAVQGENRVGFNLFLPSGTRPAGGWPVAIFGHGFGDSKNGSPFAVAASMAQAGIATIAINVVGHGGGELGTMTVNQTAGAPVTFSAGGRGIDQDGNGSIDATEGRRRGTAADARLEPRRAAADRDRPDAARARARGRDGRRRRRLPRPRSARIFYFGQSFGGIYGTTLLAVEPKIRTGATNVAGGSIIEIARLSPTFRPLVWLDLVDRTPVLANLPGLFQFDENLPLRNEPPRIDTVPGAAPIQSLIEHSEWATQAANPAAYAPHLIREPLHGVPAKSVLLQFARGDRTVPNPTTSAIIRAGGLQGRTTLFRNDLARAANPAFPSNPHTFLTNIGAPSPQVAGTALAAQAQIAQFFASSGLVTIDPDGPGPLFETPMVGPPPEDLAFLP